MGSISSKSRAMTATSSASNAGRQTEIGEGSSRPAGSSLAAVVAPVSSDARALEGPRYGIEYVGPKDSGRRPAVDDAWRLKIC